MATRLIPSNDRSANFGGNVEQEVVIPLMVAGNFTADATYTINAPFAGKVAAAYLSLAANGEDGTDPWSLSLDVKPGGTTALTTLASIAKSAGTGRKTTYAASTGVVPAVVDPAAASFAAGSQIDIVLDITRTTPEVEGSGLGVFVILKPDAV